MENHRFILFIALAAILYLMFNQWQTEHAPVPPAKTEQTVKASPESDDEAPVAVTADDEIVVSAPEGQNSAKTVSSAKKSTQKGRQIEIVTDLFQIRIDTYKGAISRVNLRKYPLTVEQQDIPFTILDKNADNNFIAESGLLPQSGSDETIRVPLFASAKSTYALQEGEDELRVPLAWKSESGIELVKTFIFKRDSYQIEIEQQINNNSSSEWRGSLYATLRQKPVKQSGGFFSGASAYTGAAVSTDFNKYEKVSFDDIQENWSTNHKNAMKSNGVIGTKTGWIAMLQHYFVVAWIPNQQELSYISSKFIKKSNNHYISYASEEKVIPAGNKVSFVQKIYAGPKVQKVMKEIAPNLERSVDYGPLFFIAEPLFFALDFIHGVIGNWGWAIILLTFFIKVAFFKLSEKSYRSMAKMRNLGPKIKQLRERYGDDKQKLNQATMDLYKKEGANPLGGCLPILIQMPVFLSLYWMLMESVELRQAPFMFWITDLSLKDPFFILPLIMGGTMFLQQRLNPAPADPMQAKVMMAMPILFTAMFLWFPSGLVLYWVVNNALSILQQWIITKRVESGKDKVEAKPAKKKK
ncbi:MAG: membrane protein insertase YidC [Gammaproteobacteria bacterium]|nr:MAG: membrane protein insertase YidC [Gammaproteobacteria bacterium]